MEIIRMHETSVEENNRLLREKVLQANVSVCGIAEFSPGQVAHDGERHLHVHDEIFIILSGEITVPVEGQSSEIARTGDWVYVEAGLEHHLTNHTILPCVAMYLVLARHATD